MSGHSNFPLNYEDNIEHKRIPREDPPEKVSFSNRVDTDLVADYKEVEAPATERMFDTYTNSREETKQSLHRGHRYDYRKTSREVNHTDSTMYDFFNTRDNGSYTTYKSNPNAPR